MYPSYYFYKIFNFNNPETLPHGPVEAEDLVPDGEDEVLGVEVVELMGQQLSHTERTCQVKTKFDLQKFFWFDPTTHPSFNPCLMSLNKVRKSGVDPPPPGKKFHIPCLMRFNKKIKSRVELTPLYENFC